MAFLPDTNVWISLLKNPGGQLEAGVLSQAGKQANPCKRRSGIQSCSGIESAGLDFWLTRQAGGLSKWMSPQAVVFTSPRSLVINKAFELSGLVLGFADLASCLSPTLALSFFWAALAWACSISNCTC